jgi:uncharacterized protein (DUF1684 family)
VSAPQLELTDWRRRVARLYDDVRSEPDPATGHARWRAGRDELFRSHPQSALRPDDPFRHTGLPYWPYDPTLRFELELQPATQAQRLPVPTENFTTTLELIGHLALPDPIGATVDVWWLEQYGGGLFLPIRDGSAGHTSYGGGRYALDTAKGADLGGTDRYVTLDLNFLYHPSCRYNPEWVCPLAPPGNTFAAPINAGERLEAI